MPSSLSVLPSRSTCSAFGAIVSAATAPDDLQGTAVVVHRVRTVQRRVVGVAVFRVQFLELGDLFEIDVVEQELDVLVVEEEVPHG